MRSKKSNPDRLSPALKLWPGLRPALLWLSALAGIAASPESAVSPLPIPASPWRLELVAAAPELKHPSVVCSAPDGRIFVAEDPMDISTDRADEKAGRILCIVPGGKTTVFAEGLHAVFGMKYLEGRLYVLHNPKFSVFQDADGVGRDRIDLIESTNPEPWAKEWNDHIPANFTLGMDGFFYIAVGDKGLYGAEGRDGQRVDMHGGGVVRIRPDGTHLEIHATGLRNILDVAISDEDALFTYDNTDEKQWMSRFSHIVDGGYYGYPYDFNPRQPYILWCMEDYGPGAATGALIDTEARLPAPFGGRAFLSDFGKRQVTAVRLERQGSTFKASDPLELFPDPPADFRPVGICLSADGSSLYLCDWQHRDNKEKVAVGRLFKLTHSHPLDIPAPPVWWTNAASGRPITATPEELIEGLSHPARSVRLVAQRRLSDRGQETVPYLTELLLNPKAQVLARCHAVWALDGIDAGESSRSAIRSAIYSVEPGVRRQALRQLGTRGVRSAVEEVVGRLDDEDLSVRFQAATALARIADPAAFRALWESLTNPTADPFLTYATVTALNKMARATPSLWPRIVAGLNSKVEGLADKVRWICRETYESGLISALSEAALNPKGSEGFRRDAVRMLSDLHRKTPEWKGEWWAYHPVNLPPPVKNRDWEFTPIVADTLRALLADSSPTMRSAACDAIAASQVSSARPDLRTLYRKENDPRQREHILSTLGALKDPESAPLVLEVLRTPGNPESTLTNALAVASRIGSPTNSVTQPLAESVIRFVEEQLPTPSLTAQALEVLGQLEATSATLLMERRLEDTSIAVVTAALHAWTRISTNSIPLIRFLSDSRQPLRAEAVRLCGSAKVQEAVPHLLALASQALPVDGPVKREEILRALASMPDLRGLPLMLSELTNKNFASRELARRYLTQIRESALPELESKAAALPSESLMALQSLYADHPKATNGPLFSRKTQGKAPEDFLAFALSTAGDVGRGRQVFANQNGLACVKCHRVTGEGGDVGPDLTQIGVQFDRKALAESVLWPSRVVREGYQQTVIELKDGESVSGLVKGETAESITLRGADGLNQTIAKSQIQSRDTSALSLMPEGLHSAITPQEFADLLSYLQSLTKAK